MYDNEVINLDQYTHIMQLLDLDSKIVPVNLDIETLNKNLFDRFRVVGRSKQFNFIGTIFTIPSVLLVTIQV
ncbi:unnamed protein product [Adineta steineri]|uniref:Uncharacterized protein n=1 Tax=Adineta steineri TaxID=433720 RepID=A0A813R798_9BILA|nr:unnamed protein product [Adineta steineri]CAF0829134.1 unnamed protein product [Adineta steineri]CAF0877856.1 unnamed protein product [Adineta steineri]